MVMNLFPWKEKPLRTVWRVERNGSGSFVVGTAHFSPYSFRRTLAALIRRSETVLFEGPLERAELDIIVRRVIEGMDNGPSLLHAHGQ